VLHPVTFSDEAGAQATADEIKADGGT